MKPTMRLLVSRKDGRVCMALYDTENGDAPVGGIALTPEQARQVAQKLTWESIRVEEG